MKTNSKIVLLVAGVALSATALSTAYAQNAGGNQPAPRNNQDCQVQQGANGNAPCAPGGQGMAPQGMGQQGMGQQSMGQQAMGSQGMGPRDGDFRGKGHGKWGRQMASNENGRRGHGMDNRGGRGFGGEGRQGPNFEIMFQKADKDNSGTVTLEEFAATSPFTFTDADADGDGNITAVELADQMQRQMLLRRAERMIQRFDTDNDGQVSTAEIESQRKEMFSRLDIDESGAIEQDEMNLRGGDHHRGDRGGKFHRSGGKGWDRN